MAPNLNDVAYGLTSAGVKVPLRVDADGVLATSGGGGGGGGGSGDASAANQVAGNATLTAIDGHVDGLETSAASIDGKLTGVATAANQVSTNTKLDTLATDIGAPADVAATADTGTFSLIAIVKRIVAKLTSILAKQPALGTAGTASADVITVQGIASGTALAVSNASLPLPSGAATAAKQPALGTAGTASADVITVQGIASGTALSVTDTRLPTALGSNTAANSLPVTLSTDGPFPTLTGAVTETAPATDTASSGLNGRLQRIAQRLTSLIALFPTALGSTTSANSLPVTLSSDGPFSTLTGGVTETAPASDTASSGINGRLQRIAQRLTTLIAGITVSSITLPTVIYNGQKAVTTAGTRVTLAASQAILSGVTIKAKATNTGLIYVGDGSVSSTTGFILAAGDTVFLEIANLNTVNLDSSVSGEGVSFVAT